MNIFRELGFTVATGPEVETDWFNFTALNFPAGSSGDGHARHAVPRATARAAAHPHVAGADPNPAESPPPVRV